MLSRYRAGPAKIGSERHHAAAAARSRVIRDDNLVSRGLAPPWHCHTPPTYLSSTRRLGVLSYWVGISGLCPEIRTQ